MPSLFSAIWMIHCSLELPIRIAFRFLKFLPTISKPKVDFSSSICLILLDELLVSLKCCIIYIFLLLWCIVWPCIPMLVFIPIFVDAFPHVVFAWQPLDHRCRHHYRCYSSMEEFSCCFHHRILPYIDRRHRRQEHRPPKSTTTWQSVELIQTVQIASPPRDRGLIRQPALSNSCYRHWYSHAPEFQRKNKPVQSRLQLSQRFQTLSAEWFPRKAAQYISHSSLPEGEDKSWRPPFWLIILKCKSLIAWEYWWDWIMCQLWYSLYCLLVVNGPEYEYGHGHRHPILMIYSQQ